MPTEAEKEITTINILHLDDSSAVLRGIKRLIEYHGSSIEKNGKIYTLKVVSFTNPEEAIEEIKKNETMVVISDYNIDRGSYNGLDFIRDVLSINPIIPCILFCSDADEHKETLEEMGGLIINKPSTGEVLIECILELVT